MAFNFSGVNINGSLTAVHIPAPLVPPTIGQSYGGGYYAGDISTTGNGVATHRIVVGPMASANSAKQWKTSGTATAGTTSLIDGPTNSATMNNASHPAAEFCEGLTIGGYTDWYLPARNELEVCYYNLKPTTATNLTNQGINTNAVPSRDGYYTSGNPAQTSAADFKSTGAEDFIADAYWSSTAPAVDPTWAWCVMFTNGDVFGLKTSAYNVRAIRRVAI